MAVVDRRVEQLSATYTRLRTAATFSEVLEASERGHALALELAKEQAEVMRVARGWVYMPPEARPS